jgi:hypothetical protein
MLLSLICHLLKKEKTSLPSETVPYKDVVPVKQLPDINDNNLTINDYFYECSTMKHYKK